MTEVPEYSADRQQVLGENVRSYRRARKLSVSTLAVKAGISAGIISQIERGNANPSLRTLEKLCAALEVSLNALIDTEPDRTRSIETHIRRKEARPNFKVGSTPLHKQLLSPAEAGGARMMLITFPAGADSEDVVTDPGQKAGLVLEGELTLRIDGQSTILKEGDSFQFDSTLPHSVHNLSSRETLVMWLIIPEYTRPQI